MRSLYHLLFELGMQLSEEPPTQPQLGRLEILDLRVYHTAA
jgi:hypothetical protein